MARTTSISSLGPDISDNLTKYPIRHPVNMLAVEINLRIKCGLSGSNCTIQKEPTYSGKIDDDEMRR